VCSWAAATTTAAHPNRRQNTCPTPAEAVAAVGSVREVRWAADSAGRARGKARPGPADWRRGWRIDDGGGVAEGPQPRVQRRALLSSPHGRSKSPGGTGGPVDGCVCVLGGAGDRADRGGRGRGWWLWRGKGGGTVGGGPVGAEYSEITIMLAY
jgi:hypothetical protein